MEKVSRGFLYKCLMFPGMAIIWIFDRLVELTGKNIDIIESSKIPFNSLIQEKYEDIKREFEQIYHQSQLTNIDEFYKVDSDIGQNDQWKAYPFLIWNHAFENNLNQCPLTSSLLNEIPGCTSAMFSVLLPGKHILPHQGVYKGVIRCLYTLHVENGNSCWIKVNHKKCYFSNNEAIYFDETFEHEVKNESNEMRAVLYLDIYRKFSFPLNLYNKALFFLFSKSPYINTIIKEYQSIKENKVVKHHPNPEISL